VPQQFRLKDVLTDDHRGEFMVDVMDDCATRFSAEARRETSTDVTGIRLDTYDGAVDVGIYAQGARNRPCKGE
jgi:hypothetical protein